MSKIIIPSTFIKTSFNTISLPSNLARTNKQGELLNPITLFSNPDNTYVLNLTTNTNIKEFKSIASGVLGALNIHGKLEINSKKDIDWSVDAYPMNTIYHIDPDYYSHMSFNHWADRITTRDQWKFNELAINLNHHGSKLHFTFDDMRKRVEENPEEFKNGWCQSDINQLPIIKKMTFKVDNIEHLKLTVQKLEELILDCYETTAVLDNTPNLKKIILPRLKKYSKHYPSLSFPNNENPTLALNPECNISINFDGKCPPWQICNTTPTKITLKELIKKENYSEFKEQNNLIEIKYNDLNNLITLYEVQILENKLKEKEIELKAALKSNTSQKTITSDKTKIK